MRRHHAIGCMEMCPATPSHQQCCRRNRTGAGLFAKLSHLFPGGEEGKEDETGDSVWSDSDWGQKSMSVDSPHHFPSQAGGSIQVYPIYIQFIIICPSNCPSLVQVLSIQQDKGERKANRNKGPAGWLRPGGLFWMDLKGFISLKARHHQFFEAWDNDILKVLAWFSLV